MLLIEEWLATLEMKRGERGAGKMTAGNGFVESTDVRGNKRLSSHSSYADCPAYLVRCWKSHFTI